MNRRLIKDLLVVIALLAAVVSVSFSPVNGADDAQSSGSKSLGDRRKINIIVKVPTSTTPTQETTVTAANDLKLDSTSTQAPLSTASDLHDKPDATQEGTSSPDTGSGSENLDSQPTGPTSTTGLPDASLLVTEPINDQDHSTTSDLKTPRPDTTEARQSESELTLSTANAEPVSFAPGITPESLLQHSTTPIDQESVHDAEAVKEQIPDATTVSDQGFTDGAQTTQRDQRSLDSHLTATTLADETFPESDKISESSGSESLTESDSAKSSAGLGDESGLGAEAEKIEQGDFDQGRSSDENQSRFESSDQLSGGQDSSAEHQSNEEFESAHSAPIVENVDETYIDNSDPDDPKQVHYVKEIRSQTGPGGESYAHSESKTSNSIGANPNYHSKHHSASHVSASTNSGDYPYGGPNYRTQFQPEKKSRKSKKIHRNRSKQNGYKPYGSMFGYNNMATPYPMMPMMPAMRPMPVTRQFQRYTQAPGVYPMAIFPPIPNMAHAPQMPQAWQSLANSGVGYGYAYPPTYSMLPKKPSQLNNNYAYAYAGAGPIAGPGYGAGYTQKPAKPSKRQRRRAKQQAAGSYF